MSMCIYHGNCADGFGAAWVVRKALGEIEFHGAKYQEPPPDVTGKDVVMVDFSYKRPVLLEMAEKANSILILDHHKTSAEDLVDLPANVTAKFDMGHSGAMLTWEHFFPGQEPPPLLLHIEDRDLWRFALQNTRQIQANVFSFPYDFQVWDTLMETAPAALATEGEAIERKHFKDIRELLGVTTRDMVIGGHRVPVANLPYTMSSDAGHELAKGRPFAACYWDTPEGRVFSLRSSDDGADVAEVAKQYGGGGHRNAAGFRVSFAKAQAFEECVTHHSACDCREALFEQIRARCERLEVALETAMTVLEQIASTPRNRGARRNASATTAFLRTQLNVQHNDNVTVHVPLATSAVVLDESTPCQGAGGNKAGGCERLQHETVSDIIADRDRLRAALLNCARQAEALKRDCGMSPESEQAVRNGQYQAISTTAHIALGTIRGPKGRDEAACN